MRIIKLDGTEIEVTDPRTVTRITDADSASLAGAVESLLLRDLDPHNLAVADPYALVPITDAFASFAPSTRYVEARRLLSEARRRTHRNFRDKSLLPTLRCGARNENGTRCGSSIFLIETQHGVRRYHGGSCKGHFTDFHASFASDIIALICDAYAPSRIAKLPAVIAAEVKSLEAQMRALQRELDDVEERVAVITRDLVTLHGGLRSAANIVLDKDLAARTAIHSRLAAATAKHTALANTAATKRLWQVLVSFAQRLPDLFRRAKGHPLRCQELVRTLAPNIAVSTIADSMLLLELTFATGAVQEFLLLMDDVRSSQAQRILAAHLLRQSVPIVTAVEALRIEGLVEGEWRVVTPRVVHLMALLHAYFESVPALSDDAGESIAAIAERTGVDRVSVRACVLAGRFGPARIDASGELLVAPTEAILEYHLEAYALRRTAARSGWAEDDTIALATAVRDSGLRAKQLRYLMASGQCDGSFDLADRRYFRVSSLAPLLRRRGITLDPRTAESAFAAARDKAVRAAGYAPEEAASFHPAWELFAALRAIHPHAVYGTMKKRVAQGKILEIEYTGPARNAGRNAPRHLVYCPEELLRDADPSAVARFLKGELALPQPLKA